MSRIIRMLFAFIAAIVLSTANAQTVNYAVYADGNGVYIDLNTGLAISASDAKAIVDRIEPSGAGILIGAVSGGITGAISGGTWTAAYADATFGAIAGYYGALAVAGGAVGIIVYGPAAVGAATIGALATQPPPAPAVPPKDPPPPATDDK